MSDTPQPESYVREPSYGGPGDAPAQITALRDILLERQRQDAKFGEQNLDPMLYLTVLTEEVGEIAKAILDIRFGKDTLAHLREEAVQTAAVALAFVECLDRGKWKDAGGEPVTEAPAQPARRPISTQVRVRVCAGPLEGKTGTVTRWEDAGDNTWRVKLDGGDEIVVANWNLDRADE